MALSFTIPPNGKERFPTWMGLTPGQTYLLRLMATNAFGPSYVDHVFSVNSPPSPPTILMTPENNIYALMTKVRFEPSGNWTGNATNKNLRLKFGIRVLLKGNRTEDYYFTSASAITFHETFLPAAWPSPNEACGKRAGYQFLLDACDSSGSCSETVGPVFYVQQPLNSSAAESSLIEMVKADIASGNLKNAIEKLEIVGLQRCNMSFDTGLVNQIIDNVVNTVQNTSDSQCLKECIDACVRLIPFASPNITTKFITLLNRMNDMLGISIVHSGNVRRKKRSTANETIFDEEYANSLLVPYDQLLASNQNVVDAFLSTIVGTFTSFCEQVDSTRTMKTSGAKYTVVQAQGLSPTDPSFNQTTFSVAGSDENVLSFDTSFANYFSNWQCGTNGAMICSDVCLGTATISISLINQSGNLTKYFFSSGYNSITSSSLASNLYYIYFGDPLTGNSVPLQQGTGYTMRFPLNNFIPSQYYKCFQFSSGSWNNNNIQSADYVQNYNGTYELECHFSSSGILGVFAVNPPTPPTYPAYNDVEISFGL
uniref:Fibronectin type-III domain-containing protein n=1 Tax=Acrobeloides nanus TaxID=290746 RepID=A0A914CPX7_9BILA